MKAFMDEQFLLTNKTASILYHDYAKKMPILDYHCHIDAKDIYENRRFENITQLWLGGDHYKWRIMRSNGVSEEYITGDAPDREKFQKFAEALPRCIGNPMYHWCHLELKNYFGYDGVLNGKTARKVWELTSEKLQKDGFCARDFIEKSNVYMIGTTDDPCSDLKYHRLLAESNFGVKACPSFRPDPALNIHKKGFKEYIGRLSEITNIDIKSVKDVLKALSLRIEFFDKHNCRASDHGLDYIVFRLDTKSEIEEIFSKAMNGVELTKEEVEIYQTALLIYCAKEYSRLGWVMQLHFSCKRNPNSAAFEALGADAGFDSIAVTESCSNLYSLMDELEKNNKLPKTVIYSLNPSDNEWIDSLIGAFQDGKTRGKIQHGSAWWFNDHKEGMQNQMISLANLGILGNFIGMLTDSRSLVSYARHEYFRRILCNIIGTWVENGEYPCDFEELGELVKDISFNNAKRYFNI